MRFFLIIALLLGTLVPVQTAANARMRTSVGPAFAVTLISFVVSACCLLCVSAACRLPILPSVSQLADTPWWSLTGGIIALLTITATIHLFKTLGQLQTAVLPLLGQLLFSVVIDHCGLFGSVRIPLSAVRIIAMILAIAGVLSVVVLPDFRNRNRISSNAGRLLWQIIGVATGCLMASIGAIYGMLGTRLGSAVQASTISFLIATCVMLVVCVATGTVRCIGKAFVHPAPWWMWLGGLCGATSVFGNAWLIPEIGAGAFFMAFLLGQMLLSLFMERFGWMGAMKRRIACIQMIGVILMLVSVALIRV